ncbi:MAG: 2-amino-4-hydroxy-6-hydroxymethyldihydropteridine diphosphokinase [Saprospiraceae bacterium]|nr:2-amino-4-hydroxy-6-hydroxymethyldihydropteridine diphosphokinase [Bacteroidia bacterium]NNF20354.1 2-amino-4-hydroxy-6-hydroxymethyldihydropteridine diphosphokinase [Saprospiraceae bacterium]NNK89760.1 2-amino-4-hydroxy-6-hydroxymethyldihydropteridine diphosphokinase [Saprospiraceae bacterium]
MQDCILHLGSNVGDRLHSMEVALILISRRLGMIVNKSRIYVTEPWGDTQQDMFLNQAIHIITNKSPEDILTNIQKIEKKMGRVPTKKWGPRVIDIDILFYGEEIKENHNLIIPHPQITNRNFVLIPLIDICPDLIHPVHGVTIRELLKECNDNSTVSVYEQ